MKASEAYTLSLKHSKEVCMAEYFRMITEAAHQGLFEVIWRADYLDPQYYKDLTSDGYMVEVIQDRQQMQYRVRVSWQGGQYGLQHKGKT